jgi:hypothetical protein
MHSTICREACSGGDSRLTFYCAKSPCARRPKRTDVVIPCLRVGIWLQGNQTPEVSFCFCILTLSQFGHFHFRCR